MEQRTIEEQIEMIDSLIDGNTEDELGSLLSAVSNSLKALLAERETARLACSALRRIVDADVAMFHENEEGSQEEYQRAADHFYATIEAADDFLTQHGA